MRIPSEAIRTELPTIDPKLAEATLEVGLNNPILEAGFEIICSPTSVAGTLEAIRKTLQVCQVELHPFFVWGHDGKAALNSQVSGGEVNTVHMYSMYCTCAVYMYMYVHVHCRSW